MDLYYTASIVKSSFNSYLKVQNNKNYSFTIYKLL